MHNNSLDAQLSEDVFAFFLFLTNVSLFSTTRSNKMGSSLTSIIWRYVQPLIWGIYFPYTERSATLSLCLHFLLFRGPLFLFWSFWNTISWGYIRLISSSEIPPTLCHTRLRSLSSSFTLFRVLFLSQCMFRFFDSMFSFLLLTAFITPNLERKTKFIPCARTLE